MKIEIIFGEKYLFIARKCIACTDAYGNSKEIARCLQVCIDENYIYRIQMMMTHFVGGEHPPMPDTVAH